MKTSALTVGALTLLSQGIALASGESGSGSQQKIVAKKIRVTFQKLSGDSSVPDDLTEEEKKELTDGLTVGGQVPNVGTRELEHETMPDNYIIKKFELVSYTSAGSSIIEADNGRMKLSSPSLGAHPETITNFWK